MGEYVAIGRSLLQEEVAIGRSLLQHCHWGKGRGRDREIAPTARSRHWGNGRGRDREIAPTALPLGEEVAIGGRWKRSRSGDRSYSIAIGGRGRHWGKMEEVAIGRSLLQLFFRRGRKTYPGDQNPMTIFLDAATYPKILSFSFSYASTTGASSS